MADKKPTKRPGAPGGDRPMRRRDSTHSSRGDGRKTFASDKPSYDKPSHDKPRGEKTAKPRSDKAPRPAAARARPKPRQEPVEKTSAFEGERIAKAMARAGVCSRRDAEQWIAEGRVAVNGVVLATPAVNVTDADTVTIDGAPMQARERTRLFLFHKPQGLVTTASDPEGRPIVFAYLEERHPDLPRLVSVGRLDINTEGLLLLTNDGGLARTLELPATGWTRRYRVRVHGEIDQAKLDELKKGVTIDDVIYAPIEARLDRVQGANAWIAMGLVEGKNREVKRVMEHLGLDVTRLIRISYGPFQLGELAEGAVEEVKLKMLREQLGKSLAELAGVDFSSPLREATATEQQELRERVDRRSRKHVSVLRKERDERSETGPRARVTRGATADRKGRAVLVERVTPTRRKQAAGDEAPSRNAKRFDAMRAGPRKPRSAGAEGAPRVRPSRFEEQGGERPARAPRQGAGGARPSRTSGEGRDARGDRRFERGPDARPPRRDRDGPRVEERAESRASRGPRSERPRQADLPRGDRQFDAAERGPRTRGAVPVRAGADARPPRAKDPGAPGARGPRAAGPRAGTPGGGNFGKGPPRSADGGAGKGPPRGRSAAPGRGPGKGAPRKGPPKGAPGGAPKGSTRGPRKPRGE